MRLFIYIYIIFTYLLTYIWSINIWRWWPPSPWPTSHSSPISTIHIANLRRPITDLGLKVSDNIRSWYHKSLSFTLETSLSYILLTCVIEVAPVCAYRHPFLSAAGFTFNPYLLISINEFLISIIHRSARVTISIVTCSDVVSCYYRRWRCGLEANILLVYGILPHSRVAGVCSLFGESVVSSTIICRKHMWWNMGHIMTWTETVEMLSKGTVMSTVSSPSQKENREPANIFVCCHLRRSSEGNLVKKMALGAIQRIPTTLLHGISLYSQLWWSKTHSSAGIRDDLPPFTWSITCLGTLVCSSRLVDLCWFTLIGRPVHRM